MAGPFPDSPFFRGAESPCRFEAEIYDCIVYGEIPKAIDGTFYRYALQLVPAERYLASCLTPLMLLDSLVDLRLCSLANYRWYFVSEIVTLIQDVFINGDGQVDGTNLA